MRKVWGIVGVLIFLMACTDKPPVPRPKGYPKVTFPEKAYQIYDGDGCPYAFEYPVYGEIQIDSMFFDQVKDCWIDIYFPDFDATIHFTYEHINNSAEIMKLVMDAHDLTYKHARKADYIDPIPYDSLGKNYDVSGLMYDVGGDAASALQFYLTDFTDHYMRGALYFNTSPNADSLAPMVNFFREDIEHLMHTFEWQ
jgi:gliding motility-associated lipoprotein GldD